MSKFRLMEGEALDPVAGLTSVGADGNNMLPGNVYNLVGRGHLSVAALPRWIPVPGETGNGPGFAPFFQIGFGCTGAKELQFD